MLSSLADGTGSEAGVSASPDFIPRRFVRYCTVTAHVFPVCGHDNEKTRRYKLDRQSVGGDSYSGLRRHVSLAALVSVNLLPLLGVLFFDWDVAGLVILYWSENLIVGFYTLLKMLVKSPRKGLGTGLFFCIHYGIFCAAHGMAILAILVDDQIDPAPEDPWPLFLVLPQIMVNVVREVLAYAPPQWLIPFAALVVSHGISFVANFLLGGERDELRLRQIMGSPYGRIVVLHIAVIFGAVAVTALGQPIAMLVVLTLLKVAVDVKLHLREHYRAAPD